MKYFTTNWALNDPIVHKKKETKMRETEFISKEIQHKINLIEKAFR